MLRYSQKSKKSRNPKIKKSRNPKHNFFGKSKKPSKIRSFWHQKVTCSSFRCRDIARNPKKSRNPKIKKSKNPEIQKFLFVGKSKKPSKIRSFWHQRISGSSFRCRDIARNPKKSRNPKIKKSRNPEIQTVIFFENPKSPRKSGRFDTSGSPVALFVAEISCALDGVKNVTDGRTNQRTRRF